MLVYVIFKSYVIYTTPFIFHLLYNISKIPSYICNRCSGILNRFSVNTHTDQNTFGIISQQ